MKVEEEESVLRMIVDGGLPENVSTRTLVVVMLFQNHQAQVKATKEILAAFKKGGEPGANEALDKMLEDEVARIRTHPPNRHSAYSAMRFRCLYGKGG